MNFIHIFTPREIIEKDKVPGGLEKIVIDWYDMLESDTENNHYLYSFTDPEKESKPIYKNHIVTPLLIGKFTRKPQLAEDLQKHIIEKNIDCVINHAFSDGHKMATICKMLVPKEGKKLHILNICHSSHELLVHRAPFLPLKQLYTDKLTYTEESPQIKNTVFIPSSDYAAYTFSHGDSSLGLDPLGLNMYVFDGFFNIIPDDKPRKVQESDGSIVLVGRAVALKRLPETVKMLKGFKGKIHVFTKYREKNSIVERLEKMANDTINYNIELHIDADREKMMEQIGKAKCLISGCAYETGPIVGLESGEVGVPAIVAKNYNFSEKYGYETILKNVPHWSHNIIECKLDKTKLLSIVNSIPDDIEFRKKLQSDILELRGRSKFRQKFYDMINEITNEENQNKYCFTPSTITKPLF